MEKEPYSVLNVSPRMVIPKISTLLEKKTKYEISQMMSVTQKKRSREGQKILKLKHREKGSQKMFRSIF